VSVVRAHYVAELRAYLRYPSFSVPTLAFPALFFVLFVVPRSGELHLDAYVVSYAAFALLGVVFFQFGVGIALERVQPWERYLRTLPVRPLTRFAARILVALTFGALAAAVLVATAAAATTSLPALSRWPAVVAALAVGTVPHALLGISIGYLAPPRGALPLANLLYLALAYGGGLWTTAEHLPDGLATISLALPTRQWAELLWAAADGHWASSATAALAAYTVVFAAIAAWAYRRDEGERFA
jgi:ABC-2 type transport system permease protein